jgi:MscS family membrane protein
MLDHFIGMEIWRWLAIAVAILVGVIVDLVVRFVLRRILRSITLADENDSELAVILKTVPRPAGVAAGGLAWLLLLPLLDLPSTASVFIEPVVHVYITIASIWFGFRGTDLIAWVATQKAKKTQNKLDDLLVPLLRKTLKAIVFVFGIVYLASSLQFQLAPIIAGLSIGGLGFAFAAKDTIENFFGSVTVILDKPFEIGDWIIVDSVEGTVESVGMRSTRIRTFYDSLVTIPNSILVTSKCNNYSKRRYRRWKQMVSIGYSTTPEKISAFCEGIRELLRVHPYTRKDYYQVWLNEFAGSSLDILVYVFWKAPDWPTELRERHRFMLDIIRLAGELEIEFAYPTSTLYLRKEEDWENSPKKIPALRPDGWEESAREEGREIVEEFTADDDWRTHLPPPYKFIGARDGGNGGGEGGEG